MYFPHETVYRGSEGMQAIAHTHVAICGVGAIGSQLAETLVRQGYTRLTIIDHDRVEERNMAQNFAVRDVGSLKVTGMLARLADINPHIQPGTIHHRLEESNVARLLRPADVIVDCFDNPKSRGLVSDYAYNRDALCLHLGVAEDFGEVHWNEGYRVPPAADDDVCDHPLARNLISTVVAVGAESLTRAIASNKMTNYLVYWNPIRVEEI